MPTGYKNNQKPAGVAAPQAYKGNPVLRAQS